MLSEINSAAIKWARTAVNSPFDSHHWLLGPDLDWVVVILCNNFPAQPQIWPQWTHYPLIHNFHPLLPSPLPGPASTGSDANLGCLGFMNIWKLRLGWSLIGKKNFILQFAIPIFPIYWLLLMCYIWKIRNWLKVEIGGSLSTDRNLRWESCDRRLGSGSHTFWYLGELQYFKCLSEL